LVKYVITPTAFSNKKNLDTLIMIQMKENGVKDFPSYRVIAKSEDKELIITLITKIK